MLEFRHVSVACQRTPILSDISVSFPTGAITAVIGPNGCGKTTLLQCLNGVSTVTSGQILLDDKDYLALAPRERARRLAMLPQVRTVIPSLPVKTLVEHGRFPHLGFARQKTPEDVRIVEEAMAFAHVSEYADQSVDTLSGGIRQRVFFAMTLAQDCPYLVLDEPCTYLDIRGQRDFLSMLRTLRSQGRTIILVLHDLSQAIRIADHLVVMNNRKIAAAGSPEDCLKQHIIEDVFETTCKRFADAEGIYYIFE
ncbi:MAG: ABC transporter ATP-binding protein [Roseburia sp.]